MLDWHKRLIELRRNEPCLSDGDLKSVKVLFDEDRRWIVIKRGPIIVACNLHRESQAIPLPDGRHRLLMSSEDDVNLQDRQVTLPSDSVVILTRSA